MEKEKSTGNKMKTSTIVIIVIVAIILLLCGMIAGSYNGLVSANEEVDSKYAQISTQLQRRADLIPNLVNTVKGYAKHEKEVIDSVTDARSKLLNANTPGEKAAANDKLTESVNKLLMVVENYPELKADKNFLNLQDELAGTENRITVARNEYNESVENYNKTIKKFPKNIIAGMFNFEEKEYFKNTESANEVPNVSFE